MSCQSCADSGAAGPQLLAQPSASKARWMVFGTHEPATRASSPAALKALIAFSAVSVSQPRSLRNLRGPFAIRAGQQNLAATHHKRIARAQALRQGSYAHHRSIRERRSVFFPCPLFYHTDYPICKCTRQQPRQGALENPRPQRSSTQLTPLRAEDGTGSSSSTGAAASA